MPQLSAWTRQQLPLHQGQLQPPKTQKYISTYIYLHVYLHVCTCIGMLLHLYHLLIWAIKHKNSPNPRRPKTILEKCLRKKQNKNHLRSKPRFYTTHPPSWISELGYRQNNSQNKLGSCVYSVWGSREGHCVPVRTYKTGLIFKTSIKRALWSSPFCI